MDDPSRHFSGIRVWGTIGWIVAGLVISYLFAWDSACRNGAGHAREYLPHVLRSLPSRWALYSFTLPATPPAPRSSERSSLGRLLGFDALVLLKQRNFAVFFVASILICIPLAFYYQNANQFLTEIHVANATGKQTIGQMSEVLFMLLIPAFLQPLRHEDHAACRHAGLGLPLCAVRFRQCARACVHAYSSALRCTACAMTSSSSPGRSTPTPRPARSTRARHKA